MRKLLIGLTMVFLLGACQEVDSSRNDTTGPYINLNKYEFDTTVGHSIDFSNITAYDDVDGLVPVIVRGDVDYNQPGEYYLTLVAVDYSNNQTDVGITVRVHEAGYIEQNNPQETPEEVNTGCEKGKDSSLPCDVVLEENLQEYTTLFYSEEAKERCESKAVENETVCEVIYRNDKQVWGYGLRPIKEEEQEKDD